MQTHRFLLGLALACCSFVSIFTTHAGPTDNIPQSLNVKGGFGGSRDPATGYVVDDGWAQMGLPVENGSPEGVGYDPLRQNVGGNGDATS